MGGGLALLLAPDGRFDVSSVNYGTAPKDAYTTSFLGPACPIVGNYGAKDRMLRARLIGSIVCSPRSVSRMT